MNTAYIKRFSVDLSSFSEKEKTVFQKLIEASELLGSLYEQQKDVRYPGAGFYPSDAAKQEIETASQKNPAILSPYTFVVRERKGDLKAIPFHVKFKKELKPIAGLLREAAKISDDKNLSRYLESRAKALLTDNYDESNILWLKTEKSKIGCVIGPFDRYLDKIFFKKRAYMAWVGILDEKRTNEAERLNSMIFSSERKFLPGAKKAKIPQIRVRIEDTAIFSGLVADFMFAGNNLPSSADIDLIKTHGTLFTVFNPSVRWRFEKWIWPIFQSVFNGEFQARFSQEELYKGLLRSIVLHETCHSLMRYDDAAERLQEYFPFFDELHTDILAVKSCGLLLLKDALSQKELEAFLITYICRQLHWLTDSFQNPQLIHYATGGAISLKFLLETGALKKEPEKFILDFGKIFICIDELSDIIEHYLALGKHSEAKEFIDEYGSLEIFEEFKDKLEKFRQ